jgi:hypothetical protein
MKKVTYNAHPKLTQKPKKDSKKKVKQTKEKIVGN